MSEQSEGITFPVIVSKVATTSDGGWRITLDCGDDASKQVQQLAALRSTLLQAAFVQAPEDQD